MPVLRTTSVRPGMVLAADAVSPERQVVVKAGAHIDKEILDILITRRVQQVDITEQSFVLIARTDDSPGGDGAKKSKTRMLLDDSGGGPGVQAGLARVAHMFADYRENPLMRELCRLAIKCVQERLIRG